MQKVEPLSYEEQFKDAVVAFGPFALRSTGIIQSQTVLKVETYSLACVPYQLSMSKAVLIGSFTKDEIIFFQRFKGALAGLTLSVQRPTLREPQKIFCRCQISGVGLMKGRDRVGLIVCDFKPIPPDLAAILGEHLLDLERLKAEFLDFKDKSVLVDPSSSRKLGYNNFAVLAAGGDQQKIALYSLAVNRLEFLTPLRSADLSPGLSVSFSLFFQRYRLTVPGRIERAERLPTGVQRARAVLDFSPELCDIMSEYFYPGASLRKD
jgi:hypothetical protein